MSLIKKYMEDNGYFERANEERERERILEMEQEYDERELNELRYTRIIKCISKDDLERCMDPNCPICKEFTESKE